MENTYKYDISMKEFRELKSKTRFMKDRVTTKRVESFNLYLNRKKISISDKNIKQEYDEHKAENRLDFNEKTKADLERISGCYCNICYDFTYKEEKTKNGLKYVSVGEASHIISASENGPRTDLETRKKDPDYIRSISNGIWTCRKCHVIIDHKDLEEKYSIESLRDLKTAHQYKISKMELYKEIPESILKNLTKENLADYFYKFKTKEEALKTANIEELFSALNESTENLVYINENGFKYMSTDLKSTLTALNSLFEKKDCSIKVVLSDKKDEFIDVPFAFGIRLNNSNIKYLIDLKITSARKISKDEKSSLLKAENVFFDIFNNNVYVIELSDRTKIFISKEKDLIYFNFSNLVLNIMKYNKQNFIINLNGIKKEIAFY